MHRSFSLPLMPAAAEFGITLVCVTDQFACLRLIQGGKAMAQLTNNKLQVIHIANPQDTPNPEALEFLYRTTAENGGEMRMEFGEQPVRSLISYLKRNPVVNVITGIPFESDSLVYTLWERFPQIHFFLVEEDGQVKRVHKQSKTTA